MYLTADIIYLFREVNSFVQLKLKENVELRETDDVQGQISEHIFKVKWRLLTLLSFKYSSQGSFENWGTSDDIPQFYLRHIQSCEVFNSTACE